MGHTRPAQSRTPVKVWLLPLLLVPAVSGQVIYDISFSAPAQTAGQPVRTGSGPLYPSAIRFGSPTVQASEGSLTDQQLILDMDGNPAPFYYDQIALNLSLSRPKGLLIEFDIETHSVVGSVGAFAMLFDSPSTRAVKLLSDGSVAIMNPNPANTYTTQRRGGGFRGGGAMHLEGRIDFERDEWGASLNSSPMGASGLLGVRNVSTIRFSYGMLPGPILYVDKPDQSYVAIDNIRVSVVPEPSAYGAILGSAALLGAVRRRRR